MSLKFASMLMFKCLLILCIVCVTNGQLRIRQGLDLPEKHGEKGYMVYLTLSPSAKVYYDAWICGGAIVAKSYILTSAACVEDVSYMYAIAGYKEYVRFDQIHTNACTKNVKKKVVEYCVPSSYEFQYHKLNKWAHIDMALAKVESPYVLDATNAADGCSYPPRAIAIGFYSAFQAIGTDAMVYGWGHNGRMRRPEDPVDYNSKILKFATTHIIDKKICQQEYGKSKEIQKTVFDKTIEKYMICTGGKGKLDADGTLVDKEIADNDGCDDKDNRRSNCADKNDYMTYVNVTLDKVLRTSYTIDPNDLTRKNYEQLNPYGYENVNRNVNEITNKTQNAKDTAVPNIRSQNDYLQIPGICQNDHGGPLVTWVGSQEYLIGIASVFIIYGKTQECIGPYLFTSTHCNSHFLRCILGKEALQPHELRMSKSDHENGYEVTATNSSTTGRPTEESVMDLNFTRLRRGFNLESCNQTARQKGYDIINKKISWRNHPDGPAHNEIEEDKYKEFVKILRAMENPEIERNNQEKRSEDTPLFDMSDILSDFHNDTVTYNNTKKR